MRATHGLHLGIALVLLLQTAAAWAQDAGAIELTTLAQKELRVVAADGDVEPRLVPAGKVVPGDRVLYTIVARNVSGQGAERVVITDPIPEHMTYLDGTAQAAEARVYFSVDGGMRFDDPQKLEVVADDGTPRPAEARDYTHIRFVLEQPLEPDAEKSVRFAAQLD